MDAILDGITYIASWLASGIYDTLTNVLGYWLAKLNEAVFLILLYFMQFGWDIFKIAFAQLDLSNQLNSMLSGIESKTLNIVFYMRIPEALNIILTGAITRYVLNFIPFI